MRLSLFAGLPSGLITFMLVQELALRHTDHGSATFAAIIAVAIVLSILIRADERRFASMLNPPAKNYRVRKQFAWDYITEALSQSKFESRGGVKSAWKITESNPLSGVVRAKITITQPVINLNVIAWILDNFDKGWRPRTIKMSLLAEELSDGTRVRLSYALSPLLDWTGCEKVIGTTNAIIEDAINWAYTHANI